jgi:hypothetical protein
MMPKTDAQSQAHPYMGLGAKSFWRTAVAGPNGEDFSQLFLPKFAITAADKIATAGSCFAQRLGQSLRASGYQIIDAEPAPEGLSQAQAAAFGFGLYSARYGNIYTPRQLLNLLREAAAGAPHTLAWQKQGRWFDALRQTVEPEGLDTRQEVFLHRAAHLAALRNLLSQADIFIFTLGMTEAWIDVESQIILPVCPGVIAGTYSTETTHFVNYRYPQIMADLESIRAELLKANPAIKLLLTVSPVPITATATGNHVLTAAIGSKSSLRAATEDFAAAYQDVDYFPSYDIVMSPAAFGKWFEPNLRNIRPEAVASIMSRFLSAYGLDAAQPQAAAPSLAARPAPQTDESDDLICEDQLLQAFSK